MRVAKLAVPIVVVGGILVVMLSAGSMLPAGMARLSSTAPPPPRPASAGLLRRLAAAADGYRTGRPVWVVASDMEPYAVSGVFQHEDSAISAQRSMSGYDVYGPYTTPRDWGRMPIWVARPHMKPTIYGEDNRPRWRLPDTPWLADDIDSVVVTAHHRSGATWRGVSRGLEVDAVFFTVAAHDKFVYPYYAGLYGPDAATRMRESLGAYIRRAPEGP